MKRQTGGNRFLGKAMLATALFAGMLAFTGTPSALADDDHGCQRRIAKAHHRLHEAVEHHGWESKQADRARHQLREAREHCWHTERDWDDHDHDRH